MLKENKSNQSVYKQVYTLEISFYLGNVIVMTSLAELLVTLGE